MASELEQYTSASKKVRSRFTPYQKLKFEADTKNSGFTLPGHKYEGPGNSINRGDPTSVADAVAQLHDTEYFDATTSLESGTISRPDFNQRIRDSDNRAINNFKSVGGIAGITGQVGLTVKSAADSLFNNPLYPIPGNTLKWILKMKITHLLLLEFLLKNDVLAIFTMMMIWNL